MCSTCALSANVFEDDSGSGGSGKRGYWMNEGGKRNNYKCLGKFVW